MFKIGLFVLEVTVNGTTVVVGKIFSTPDLSDKSESFFNFKYCNSKNITQMVTINNANNNNQIMILKTLVRSDVRFSI